MGKINRLGKEIVENYASMLPSFWSGGALGSLYIVGCISI